MNDAALRFDLAIRYELICAALTNDTAMLIRRWWQYPRLCWLLIGEDNLTSGPSSTTDQGWRAARHNWIVMAAATC
jgi:hypothetical protein